MSENSIDPNNGSQEELETGLKVLSFCIPLAGAIIYFMNKDKAPKKAKAACTMALWGFGIAIVLNILATVLGGAASFMGN
ncbi:hypothetical protein GCM10022393_35400 [Aquimarina addita]|uniref:DUF4190 domain-containing protein n=1 Tax=Aquimarina addita TaxID=870485 RepID=A0ABP6UTM0_9FLAO